MVLAGLSAVVLALGAGAGRSPQLAALERCEELAESGDGEAALAGCHAATELAVGAGDHGAEAASALQTGFALSTLGREVEAGASYAHAEELARAAISESRHSADREGESTALSVLGSVLFQNERLEEALEAYRAAQALATELADLPAQARNGLLVCRTLIRLSRPAEGLPTCQEALSLARRTGLRLYVGYSLNNIGRAQLNLGRAEEAARTFAEAVAFHREAGERKLEAEEVNNLGAALRSLGSFDEAIESFQQARALRHDLQDYEGEAATLSNLGATYVNLGRLDTGVAQLELARELFRRIENRRSEGIVLTNLGEAESRLGRSEKALVYLEKSLALLRALHDTRAEARCLDAMGKALVALSRFEEALPRFQEALAALRAIGDRQGEGAALGHLGSAYENLGRSVDAAEAQEQSLAIAREVGDRAAQAVALRALGLARENQGDAAGALDLYHQAQALAAETNDRREVGIAAGSAARALEALGRSAEAHALGRESLAIAREVRDRRGQGLALLELGDLAMHRGEAAVAVGRYGEALTALREVKDRTMEGVALQGLMAGWSSLHHPALATLYGKLAVNAFQDVRDRIRPLDRESRRAFLIRRSEAYHHLADLLLDEGRLPEAQQVLALVKVEDLGRFLRWEDESERVSLTRRESGHARRQADSAQALAALGEEEEALRKTRNRRPEEEARFAALPALLDSAQGALDRLMQEAHDDLDASQVGRESAEPALEEDSLAGRGRDLGSGVAALYTLVTPSRYRVLLVAPGVRRVREHAIGGAELARRVLVFRAAIQDPGADPRAQARALHDILVGPVAADLAELRPRTLVWSLDGVLRYVPLAALHDGGRYLVERYRLVVATPGTRDGSGRPAPRAWSAWGFGVSRAVAGFPALPAVGSELKQVIRSRGAPRGALPGDVLLDGAFTREALWRALSSSRPVVHIASHFRFEPGASSESFLLLGDGGRLTLEELSRHPRVFDGVEILTLSACDTALAGDQSGGGELEGLGAVAQRQGAAAVVATLWPVEDRSTAELMAQFYRRAGPGRSKSEALRQAQLALLHGEARVRGDGRSRSAVHLFTEGRPPGRSTPYAHPYHWAPFVLMGDWR